MADPADQAEKTKGETVSVGKTKKPKSNKGLWFGCAGGGCLLLVLVVVVLGAAALVLYAYMEADRSGRGGQETIIPTNPVPPKEKGPGVPGKKKDGKG